MIPTIWRSDKVSSRNRNFPMLSLFDEIGRFFDESNGMPWPGGKVGSTFAPRLDLKETATEFIVTGEFPGMTEKEIQIELRDNTITISGEKRSEHEEKDGERTYIERSYGSFVRTIPFDVEVDEDNATASMKNGVLTIRVPKTAKAVKGAKRLNIKAS